MNLHKVQKLSRKVSFFLRAKRAKVFSTYFQTKENKVTRFACNSPKNETFSKLIFKHYETVQILWKSLLIQCLYSNVLLQIIGEKSPRKENEYFHHYSTVHQKLPVQWTFTPGQEKALTDATNPAAMTYLTQQLVPTPVPISTTSPPSKMPHAQLPASVMATPKPTRIIAKIFATIPDLALKSLWDIGGARPIFPPVLILQRSNLLLLTVKIRIKRSATFLFELHNEMIIRSNFVIIRSQSV